MSNIVAFLVSPPCHLCVLEQLDTEPDSPETAKEGGDSSPALLTAFPQSRGNHGAEVVLILRGLR